MHPRKLEGKTVRGMCLANGHVVFGRRWILGRWGTPSSTRMIWGRRGWNFRCILAYWETKSRRTMVHPGSERERVASNNMLVIVQLNFSSKSILMKHRSHLWLCYGWTAVKKQTARGLSLADLLQWLAMSVSWVTGEILTLNNVALVFEEEGVKEGGHSKGVVWRVCQWFEYRRRLRCPRIASGGWERWWGLYRDILRKRGDYAIIGWEIMKDLNESKWLFLLQRCGDNDSIKFENFVSSLERWTRYDDIVIRPNFRP